MAKHKHQHRMDQPKWSENKNVLHKSPAPGPGFHTGVGPRPKVTGNDGRR